VKFLKGDERTWAFDDPAGIPPSHTRWGGVTLLLSGPQTRRDLTATKTIIVEEDRPQYGLDDPQTIVDVGLSADRQIQFRLGGTTTDGSHHYGEVIGFDELFLIASSWGDVLARLAYDPPLPKWFIKRDPQTIEEVNVYRGDPESGESTYVSLKQEDGEWSVVKIPLDGGEERPVDPDRLGEILPLLAGPPVSVAVPVVDDGDYAPYGIIDEGQAIEIRFSGLTDRGTRYIDGVLLSVGSKAPDGSGYYAKAESDFSRQPVLLLDPEWTETLLGLYDDIPYAPETASEGSAQAN
ncbi:MAG: DUF4340 domain-containing protein, partial [Nitrospinota bacterium]